MRYEKSYTVSQTACIASSFKFPKAKWMSQTILIDGIPTIQWFCGDRIWPSDLVAFANLIHAPGESAKCSEEDSNGAWTLRWNSTGVSNWWKTPWWRPILKDGHILHARHTRFRPYHCLRHFSQFRIRYSRILLTREERQSTVPDNCSLFLWVHARNFGCSSSLGVLQKNSRAGPLTMIRIAYF